MEKGGREGWRVRRFAAEGAAGGGGGGRFDPAAYRVPDVGGVVADIGAVSLVVQHATQFIQGVWVHACGTDDVGNGAKRQHIRHLRKRQRQGQG